MARTLDRPEIARRLLDLLDVLLGEYEAFLLDGSADAAAFAKRQAAAKAGLAHIELLARTTAALGGVPSPGGGGGGGADPAMLIARARAALGVPANEDDNEPEETDADGDEAGG